MVNYTIQKASKSFPVQSESSPRVSRVGHSPTGGRSTAVELLAITSLPVAPSPAPYPNDHKYVISRTKRGARWCPAQPGRIYLCVLHPEPGGPIGRLRTHRKPWPVFFYSYYHRHHIQWTIQSPPMHTHGPTPISLPSSQNYYEFRCSALL